MHSLCLLLALLGAPFWEVKPSQTWNDAELQELFNDSPWGEVVNPDPGIQIYLATARPMQEAEVVMARRNKTTLQEADPDYAEFLEKDSGKHIVIAIPYPNPKALADTAESKRMEEESTMRVGRKRYKATGHFPPIPSDPVLRLVFPREVGEGVKNLVFELYLPGIPTPYRIAEFRIKDLVYKGKPEM